MRFWNSIFGNSDNNENREQDGSKGKDKGTAKGFERLFSQSLKKKGGLLSRKLQIEQFEAREMLSIDGPQLNSIFINQDQQRSLSDESTLYIAPTSFLLRFSEGQAIDPASLGGIQVYRSGGDGVFATDASGTNSIPDIKVEFGYIGVGDYENEVIIRFAENLPDDLYQIRLVGGGDMTKTEDLNNPAILKSVNGKVGTKESFYNMNPDARYGETHDIQTVRFDLQLGAKVTSIVTQPTYRNADGTLNQSRNTIEVYFSDDELKLPADPTKLFQLITTQNTLNPDDDLVIYPTKVDYKYNAVVDGVKVNRAILTFEKDAAGNAITDLAQIGTGSFRLRLGETYHKTDTHLLDLIDAEDSVGDTFKTSYKIEVKDFDTASANPQSLIIHGQINRQYDPVEYPGGRDDPGHRDLPRDFGFDGDNHIGGDTIDGAKDVESGVTYRYYNFKDVLGVNPKGGTYRNSISEAQKDLARTIFDMYSRYLGIQFIETADMGITVATGDLAWLGGVSGELLYGRSNDLDGAILDGTKNWGADVYGGTWFNTAFHEIGHCLGFEDAYDLMPGTNMTAGSEDNTTVTDGNGIALNVEQTYPGIEDIIHGKNMYRPDSNDIDMYEFTLANGGKFSAEIYAQRASASSQLNADLKIYQQVRKILGKKADGSDEVFITYELVAQNDDYFGKDPFIELYLPAGKYYVAVTSTGNDDINPQMSDTGGGGRTLGSYELRLNYSSSGVDRENPNTFKDSSGNYIVDKDGIKLDGDDDMVPGGAYDYWFNVQQATSTATTTDVSKINRTLYVDNSGRQYNADGTPVAIDPNQTRAESLVGNGTLANPFKTIKNALERAGEVQQQLEAYAKAHPLEKIDTTVIVRIVGNNQTGNIKDAKAYEIGTNSEDRNKATLTDGATFDIPKGVSVVIDAGVVIKLGAANITVGSADLNIDRSGGSLQVLGTPVHQVYFTSYLDETIGRDTYPLTTTAKPGDWGGIVIRNDVDYEFIDNYDASSGKNRREVLEKQGIFLNYINNGDFRYGGGSQSDFIYQPIHIIDARPTVTYNTITVSAHAAMSATPKSFEETRFQNWDHLNAFTTDIVRVGPHIHGNTVVRNSMNGLLVDTKTPINTQVVQKVEIAARFDDLDIVHILTENLIVAGHSGGSVLTQPTAPSLNLTDWVNNSPGINGIGSDDANLFNDTYLDQKLTFTKVPEDREYFSLTDGETKVTFEFNRVDVEGQGYNNTSRVQAGRVCIDILSTDTIQAVVAKTIAAINAVQANKEVLVNLAGETGKTDSTRLLYLLANQRLTPDQFKITALQDPDGYAYALALKGTGQRIDVNGVGLIKSRTSGSLVVNPGVVVKSNNSRIELEYGAQMLAEGTENQPIIFTSLYDNRFGGGGTFNTSSKADGLALGTAAPGNWSGIVQFPNSNLSMDHTVFAYAGGSSRIEGNLAKFNPIEIREADARITNSRFEFNTGNSAGNYVTDRSGRGMITPSVIYVRGSQPIIIGNEFYSNQNFKADGITQETDSKRSLSVISINANAFTDEIVVDHGRSTGSVNRHIEFDDNYGPLVRLNRYTDNTLNGLVVRGEVLTTESVWDDADITHVLFNEIVIPNFHSTGGLRLMSENGSSLVVKLLTDTSNVIGKDTSQAGFTTTGKPLEIDDRIGGSMQVVGVPGYPVIFTSLKDDTVGSGFDIKGQVMYDTNNTAQKDADGKWTDLSVPQPGDWRSIKFDRYSHDRNVLVVKEFEKAGSLEDSNGKPGKDGNSQYLGYLAPNVKSGDDLQRLGFEVHGSIRATDPTDSDIYRFTAQAGTEVWIDIDWTGRGLDTVLEIIDADGNILASSDNSFYEGPDEYGRYINRVYDHDYDPETGDHGTTIGFNGGKNAFGLNKDSWERVTIGATEDAFNGVGYNDKYSTNVRDAGLRYVCEGTGEKDYYVRVRSVLSISWANGLTKAKSNGKEFYIEDTLKQRVTYRLDFDKEGIEPNSNDRTVVIGLAGVDSGDYAATIIKALNEYTYAANRNLKVSASLSKYSLDDTNPVITLNGVGLFFNPQDTGLVAQENSSGFYQLQIRLQEMDEVPGCSVAYADIRYAINGVEAYGFPQHSPLLGEVQLGNGHTTYADAQKIGNLLEADRNTISVAGYLASLSDVNWYTFDMELAGIQNISGVTDGSSLWSTIFDIDYADGLTRPDLSIWVFNQAGQLIYMGSDSNVADDRPGPTGTRPNSYPEGTISKLSAGSVGGNDPFIGPALLQSNVKGDPTKTYFVAVTSKYVQADAVGGLLNAGKGYDNAKTRIEPIDTITRVLEEHVNGGQNFGWNTNDPDENRVGRSDVETPQRLVLTPDEYHLGDVVTYLSTDLYSGNPDPYSRINMINPFTGEEILNGGTGYVDHHSSDIALWHDGRLQDAHTWSIHCAVRTVDQSNYGKATSETDTTIRPTWWDGDNITNWEVGGDSGFQINALTTSRPGDYINLDGYSALNRGKGYSEYSVAIGNMGAGTLVSKPNDDFPDIHVVTSNVNVLYLLEPTGLAIDHYWSTNSNGKVLSSVVPFQTFNNQDVLIGDWIDKDKNYHPGSIVKNVFQEVGEIITAVSFNSDGSRLYAGTDTGAVYEITNWKSQAYAVSQKYPDVVYRQSQGAQLNFLGYLMDDTGRTMTNLSGFCLGPQTVEASAYKNLIFGTTSDGRMFSFNPDKLSTSYQRGEAASSLGRPSVLEPVFSKGAKVVSIPLNANGIAFAQIDYNLWHRTGTEADAIYESPSTVRGHKEFDTPGEQEQRREYGGTSWYFGLETYNTFTNYPVVDGQPNANWMTQSRYQVGPDATGFNQGLSNNGSYDLPGGTYGSLTSNTFSLGDYASEDKPMLYFSYKMDAEDQSLNNYGDDAIMVFVSTEGDNWTRVASANYDMSIGTNVGDSHHADPYNYADMVSDNQWRQARVDLSRFAGMKNVQLKFVFSTTGGQIGLGQINKGGTQFTGVAASQLFDTRNGIYQLPDKSLSSELKPGHLSATDVMYGIPYGSYNVSSDSGFILGNFGSYNSATKRLDGIDSTTIGSAVVYEYQQGYSLYIPTGAGGQGQAELNDYFLIETTAGTKKKLYFGELVGGGQDDNGNLVGGDLNLLRSLNSEEFMTRLIGLVETKFGDEATANRYTLKGGAVSSSNPYVGQQIYFDGVASLEVVGSVPGVDRAKQFVVTGGPQDDILGQISRMSNAELLKWLNDRSAILTQNNNESLSAFYQRVTDRMNNTVPIPIRGDMTAEEVSASIAFMVNLTMNDDLKVYLKDQVDPNGKAWATLDSYYNLNGALNNLARDEYLDVRKVLDQGSLVTEVFLKNNENLYFNDRGDVYDITVQSGNTVFSNERITTENGAQVTANDVKDVYSATHLDKYGNRIATYQIVGENNLRNETLDCGDSLNVTTDVQIGAITPDNNGSSANYIVQKVFTIWNNYSGFYMELTVGANDDVRVVPDGYGNNVVYQYTYNGYGGYTTSPMGTFVGSSNYTTIQRATMVNKVDNQGKIGDQVAGLYSLQEGEYITLRDVVDADDKVVSVAVIKTYVDTRTTVSNINSVQWKDAVRIIKVSSAGAEMQEYQKFTLDEGVTFDIDQTSDLYIDINLKKQILDFSLTAGQSIEVETYGGAETIVIRRNGDGSYTEIYREKLVNNAQTVESFDWTITDGVASLIKVTRTDRIAKSSMGTGQRITAVVADQAIDTGENMRIVRYGATGEVEQLGTITLNSGDKLTVYNTSDGTQTHVDKSTPVGQAVVDAGNRFAYGSVVNVVRRDSAGVVVDTLPVFVETGETVQLNVVGGRTIVGILNAEGNRIDEYSLTTLAGETVSLHRYTKVDHTELSGNVATDVVNLNVGESLRFVDVNGVIKVVQVASDGTVKDFYDATFDPAVNQKISVDTLGRATRYDVAGNPVETFDVGLVEGESLKLARNGRVSILAADRTTVLETIDFELAEGESYRTATVSGQTRFSRRNDAGKEIENVDVTLATGETASTRNAANNHRLAKIAADGTILETAEVTDFATDDRLEAREVANTTRFSQRGSNGTQIDYFDLTLAANESFRLENTGNDTSIVKVKKAKGREKKKL